MASIFQHVKKSCFSGCKLCSTYSKMVKFSNGKNIKFKVEDKILSGCHGFAEVNMDSTVVTVSAVAKEKVTNNGFLPLTVDFSKKYPPSYFVQHKRQHAKETDILIARTIDRSIRPLFTSGMECEIQLISNMICTNGEHSPDVIGINAASACLATSSIPWNGPIAAVRVGYINDQVILFPTRQEMLESQLNLVVVVGRGEKIVMLEGNGNEVKKEVFKKALTTAVKECQPIISLLSKLADDVGLPKQKMSYKQKISEDIMEATRALSVARIKDVFTTYTYNKHSRDNEINKINIDVSEKLSSHFKSSKDNIPALEIYNTAYKMIVNEVFRELILKDGIRIDGRKENELRPIYCSVNMYDPLHGSARFERGQTIVESALSIYPPNNKWEIDPHTGLSGNFRLEYKFPPNAVGEIGNSIKISRREIGHGALAKKALASLIPELPYSLYLTTDVIASNGSSSMATVCGGSMALLDAGINISSPASGVAIGLVTKCNEMGDIKEYKLLTDIMGFEDYFGDMDFKIATTIRGITAVQADIKLSGLPVQIALDAIDKAVIANNEILKIMKMTISEPTPDKSNLPVSKVMEILPGQRLLLHGIGGKTLKLIEAKTGVKATWETLESKGFAATLSIFAPNQKAMDEALVLIENNMQDTVIEPQHGQICNGIIKEVLDFGVFVELLPGMKPALISNDHLHTKKIIHPSDLDLNVGDQLKVQYFGKDPVSGRIRLSRKSFLLKNSTKSKTVGS